MAKTAAKGTKENPYSLDECDRMLEAGTWPGGYVRFDDGEVAYTPKGQAVANGYSGSGSGSDWHGSDSANEFSTGSYEWHEPDTDNKGCDGKSSNDGKIENSPKKKYISTRNIHV